MILVIYSFFQVMAWRRKVKKEKQEENFAESKELVKEEQNSKVTDNLMMEEASTN